MIKIKTTLFITISFLILLTACGAKEVPHPYAKTGDTFPVITASAMDPAKATPFASLLCVSAGDNPGKGSIDVSTAQAVGLFDINARETLYAKNIYDVLNPASLTKVMTALLCLENGNLDDIIVLTESVNIKEKGATLAGLKPGDMITLEQALNLLLIVSANDAANAIAEYIGGSVDGFVNMMNERALSLGATATHFENAHGLTSDNHKTTVYDLYLIFAEAMKYDIFSEIINKSTYDISYTTADGIIMETDFKSTNWFFSEKAFAPDGITVIGAKTGTTAAAGSCLILLSQDREKNPYIAVILHSDGRENLYRQMESLLGEIGS